MANLGTPIDLPRFGMKYRPAEGATVRMAGWVPPLIFGGAGATLGAWLMHSKNSFVGGLLGFVVGALGGIFVRGRWDPEQTKEAPISQPSAATAKGPPVPAARINQELKDLMDSLQKLAGTVGMDAKATQDALARVAALPALDQFKVFKTLNRVAKEQRLDQHPSVLALIAALVQQPALDGERRVYLAERLGLQHPVAKAVLEQLKTSKQPRVAHAVRQALHPLPRVDPTKPAKGVGSSEGLDKGEQIVFVARDDRYHFSGPDGLSVESKVPRYEAPLEPSDKPRLTLFRTEQNTLCCVASAMSDGHPSVPQRFMEKPGITISIESATPEFSPEQKQLIRLFLLPPKEREALLVKLSTRNGDRARPDRKVVEVVEKELLAPDDRFSLGDVDEAVYQKLLKKVVQNKPDLYCADDVQELDFPLKPLPI